ncbi:MAG: hypothetical protein HC923_07770 [Myxococcales bacterium]|nr:hypothetical protein [Myxococcales bacterium]
MSFALVAFLGLVPWPGLRSTFDGWVFGLSRRTLTAGPFGQGPSVRLRERAYLEDQPDLDPSWTLVAVFDERPPGSDRDPQIWLNPRRVSWLPFVMASAVLIALAGRPRRTAISVGLTLGVVLLLSVLWNHSILWSARVRLFPTDAPPWLLAALHWIYEGWIGPTGSRLLEGVGLGVAIHAIGVWVSGRASPPRSGGVRSTKL